MGKNKYYHTKLDYLTWDQTMALTSKFEKELANYLIKECGFAQIIHTGESYKSIASGLGIILPDLMGTHKSGINYFIELKNKNRLLLWNQTGFDLNKVESYLKIENIFKIKVLAVFRDDEEELKKVVARYPLATSWFKDEQGKDTFYGNWIEALHHSTPDNPITVINTPKGPIKCFPLRNMKRIKDIFTERQTQLDFEVIK